MTSDDHLHDLPATPFRTRPSRVVSFARQRTLGDPLKDATRKLDNSGESTEEAELDDLLRRIAYAPPRHPSSEPARTGERWGAGGRYVIEARLGRGGMGTVYSAADTLLSRTVALKVLDAAHGDDEAAQRARLLREARIAARIEHERIVRVYDVGEHEGSLFVAMELLRGVTLRSWMAGRTAAAGEMLAVVGQIADGLAALHAAGVFHRDLKPENVMLTEQGGIRLLDFGLARHAARPGAEGGGPVAIRAPAGGESLVGLSGTPAYMAPEQWAGHPLDARVDVFALGIMVYELVTGARPFDAQGVLLVTRWVDPDFSGEAWAKMPPGLQAITARMLARDPAERFADGAAVRDALGAIAAKPVAPAALLPASTIAKLALATTEAAPVSRPRRRRSWVPVGAAVAIGAAALVTLRVATLRQPSAPRPPPAPGMAWIDVGTITVGRSPEELDRECAAIGPGCNRGRMQREVPSSQVTIPPFQLDIYEVTNEEMAATLNALGSSLYVAEDEDDHYPRYVRWGKDLGHDGEILVDLYHPGGGIEYRADRTYYARAGREREPAVQVTWYGARFFCTARGKSLPTEDEWEAAARGREDRPFPWGSAPLRCGEVVVPRDGLVSMPSSCPEKVALGPVGQAAQDVTPEGIHDLGGNAAEWVDAVYVEGNRAARIDAGTADLPRVVRGGSFFESLLARTSGRYRQLANGVGTNLAFRCALH